MCVCACVSCTDRSSVNGLICTQQLRSEATSSITLSLFSYFLLSSAGLQSNPSTWRLRCPKQAVRALPCLTSDLCVACCCISAVCWCVRMWCLWRARERAPASPRCCQPTVLEPFPLACFCERCLRRLLQCPTLMSPPSSVCVCVCGAHQF